MITILDIGTSTIAIILTIAHIFVPALLLPKSKVNSPINPVPGCRVRYRVSRKPLGRDISNHCTRSKVAAMVAVRNNPVMEDRMLRTKMVLLLEL